VLAAVNDDERTVGELRWGLVQLVVTRPDSNEALDVHARIETTRRRGCIERRCNSAGARPSPTANYARMPVMLDVDGANAWIEPGKREAEALLEILVPPVSVWTARDVGRRVRNVRYDDPGLIAEEPQSRARFTKALASVDRRFRSE